MEFLIDAVHNLYQRKTRSILTLLGISVGVFALLVMGSMAEHFNILARHFRSSFLNRLFVCERVSFWAGGGILSEDKVKVVKRIKHVKDALPTLISRLKDRQIIVIGIPQLIVGVPVSKMDELLGNVSLKEGEWLGEGSHGKVLAGWDIAGSMKLRTGSTIKIRNQEFTVSGILKKTGSIEDNEVLMELSSAQKLLHREGLITNIVVLPENNVDPSALASAIKKVIPEVEVITPADMQDQVNESLALWNMITLGCAVLSVITGALCILITMIVSIQERIPEIGIKKTIGASNSQILAEFFGESLVMAVSAWIAGVLGGLIFVKLYEFSLSQKGIALFSITSRLVFASFLAALIIGILAGIYPAWKASRVDPVAAIRR